MVCRGDSCGSRGWCIWYRSKGSCASDRQSHNYIIVTRSLEALAVVPHAAGKSSRVSCRLSVVKTSLSIQGLVGDDVSVIFQAMRRVFHQVM